MNLTLSDQHFVLISKPDTKSKDSFYIQFPKVVLKSISHYYNDNLFKTVDNEIVNLTKQELEVFEAICFLYYKRHVDTEQEMMISLPYKMEIAHMNNMNKFFDNIMIKNSVLNDFKSDLADLFIMIDFQFTTDSIKIDLVLNGINRFVEKLFV